MIAFILDNPRTWELKGRADPVTTFQPTRQEAQAVLADYGRQQLGAEAMPSDEHELVERHLGTALEA